MKLHIVLKTQRGLYSLKIRNAETKEVLTKVITNSEPHIQYELLMAIEMWAPESYNIINRTNIDTNGISPCIRDSVS